MDSLSHFNKPVVSFYDTHLEWIYKNIDIISFMCGKMILKIIL